MFSVPGTHRLWDEHWFNTYNNILHRTASLEFVFCWTKMFGLSLWTLKRTAKFDKFITRKRAWQGMNVIESIHWWDPKVNFKIKLSSWIHFHFVVPFIFKLTIHKTGTSFLKWHRIQTLEARITNSNKQTV